jgi:uncharacterized membrane protein YjjP (DUF1212 family)
VSAIHDRVERRRDEPDPAAVGFVLQLGRALHGYGYSAQRLEDVLGATADRLGLNGHQFFSTPTSIMASFGPIGRQRTHMLRVEPGEVNLGKLTALELVSLEVAQGRTTPAEGTVAITRFRHSLGRGSHRWQPGAGPEERSGLRAAIMCIYW